MIEDDEVRVWREVTGVSPIVCEHCGRTVEPGQERRIAPADARGSGAADVVTACPECWALIARGEVDAFPAEEIDPE
jgi:hypothetical protein